MMRNFELEQVMYSLIKAGFVNVEECEVFLFECDRSGLVLTLNYEEVGSFKEVIDNLGFYAFVALKDREERIRAAKLQQEISLAHEKFLQKKAKKKA